VCSENPHHSRGRNPHAAHTSRGARAYDASGRSLPSRQRARGSRPAQPPAGRGPHARRPGGPADSRRDGVRASAMPAPRRLRRDRGNRRIAAVDHRDQFGGAVGRDAGEGPAEDRLGLVVDGDDHGGPEARNGGRRRPVAARRDRLRRPQQPDVGDEGHEECRRAVAACRLERVTQEAEHSSGCPLQSEWARALRHATRAPSLASGAGDQTAAAEARCGRRRRSRDAPSRRSRDGIACVDRTHGHARGRAQRLRGRSGMPMADHPDWSAWVA